MTSMPLARALASLSRIATSARPGRLRMPLRASRNITAAITTRRQNTHSGRANRPASAMGTHDGGIRRASPRTGPLPFEPPVRDSKRTTSSGKT